MTLVVSEETGQISVARDGVLKRNYTQNSLEQLLRDVLIPQEKENWRDSFKLPFRRKKEQEDAQEEAPSAEKQPAASKPSVKKKEG